VATVGVTSVSGVAVLIGVVLAIGGGSDTTARSLILFGSVVFAVGVAPWLERRWG
jgi:hypothetical protein